MKTLLLATAATLAIGVGSAFAAPATTTAPTATTQDSGVQVAASGRAHVFTGSGTVVSSPRALPTQPNSGTILPEAYSDDAAGG
jgi:hypothetical protein